MLDSNNPISTHAGTGGNETLNQHGVGENLTNASAGIANVFFCDAGYADEFQSCLLVVLDMFCSYLYKAS